MFLFGSISELIGNSIVMKPGDISSLSLSGRQELISYESYLREQRDISPATVRNYLSDLRSFVVWYETKSIQSGHIHLRKCSGYLQVYGKRNKYREVPLNATVRKVLLEYLSLVGATVRKVLLEYLSLVGTWLFVSRKTKLAITTRALGYLIGKYARIAGVEDISPHDLRHRFGYRIAETVPLHRLAQIMGHDSLDTTMVYVRGTSEDLQRDVEHIAWQ